MQRSLTPLRLSTNFHPNLTTLFCSIAGLVEVLRYHHEQPLVQAIWCQLSAQLAVCTDCVNVRQALCWAGGSHTKDLALGKLSPVPAPS